MLSHTQLPGTADDNMEEDIAQVQSSLPVLKPELEEIRGETAKDQSLRDTQRNYQMWMARNKGSVTSKYHNVSQFLRISCTHR